MSATTARRVAGGVLAMLGLVLLAAGALAWSTLGNDGHWTVHSARTDASGVYLGPATLQRIDGPVRATVEDSGPGQISIAQAPVAQVKALVEGTDIARDDDATGLPKDLVLRHEKGRAFAGLGAGDGLSEVVSGDRTVSLDVPRDVARGVVVAAEGRGLHQAVVSVEYRHSAWTTSAIVACCLGLALALAGAALLLARSRRRRAVAEHLPEEERR